MSHGLSLELGRTKTTGRDKNVKTVFATVSKDAWLVVKDWLKIGEQLYSEIDCKHKEFLPLLAKGGDGWRQGTPSYHDDLMMGRWTLSTLRQPIVKNGTWCLS